MIADSAWTRLDRNLYVDDDEEGCGVGALLVFLALGLFVGASEGNDVASAKGLLVGSLPILGSKTGGIVTGFAVLF